MKTPVGFWNDLATADGRVDAIDVVMAIEGRDAEHAAAQAALREERGQVIVHLDERTEELRQALLQLDAANRLLREGPSRCPYLGRSGRAGCGECHYCRVTAHLAQSAGQGSGTTLVAESLPPLGRCLGCGGDCAILPGSGPWDAPKTECWRTKNNASAYCKGGHAPAPDATPVTWEALGRIESSLINRVDEAKGYVLGQLARVNERLDVLQYAYNCIARDYNDHEARIAALTRWAETPHPDPFRAAPKPEAPKPNAMGHASWCGMDANHNGRCEPEAPKGEGHAWDGSDGGHRYDERGTSDCAFGCGAWAGDFSWDAPAGIDPLGKCPNNPIHAVPGDGEGA